MNRDAAKGLFITGTNTGVGKTYVAALIARALRGTGRRVGIYKPVASGCRLEGDTLVSDDARILWEAAGRPAQLEMVCPQRFAAPLMPHLAARAEGREIDAELLRTGLEAWLSRSDVVLVEGAGGLMSPLGDDEYVADLAADFGLPLLVITANALGTINQTLQTLIAATAVGEGLTIAGVVLNNPAPTFDDPSRETNRRELETRCVPPILAEVAWQAADFDATVDWFALAK